MFMRTAIIPNGEINFAEMIIALMPPRCLVPVRRRYCPFVEMLILNFMVTASGNCIAGLDQTHSYLTSHGSQSMVLVAPAIVRWVNEKLSESARDAAF